MIPRLALVVPISFPMRLDASDVVEVTIVRAPSASLVGVPARDVVARVASVDAFNMVHQPQLDGGGRCVVVAGKTPTIPGGKVPSGVPPYENVGGLVILGPCK